MEQQEPGRVWRVWVDEQNRVVSFRETADSRLMEFGSREEFLQRVDEFTARNYRYRRKRPHFSVNSIDKPEKCG